MGRIPGSKKKKMWVHEGDVVIANPGEIQGKSRTQKSTSPGNTQDRKSNGLKEKDTYVKIARNPNLFALNYLN